MSSLNDIKIILDGQFEELHELVLKGVSIEEIYEVFSSVSAYYSLLNVIIMIAMLEDMPIAEVLSRRKDLQQEIDEAIIKRFHIIRKSNSHE